jgi:predicted Zn-dependent peptidase
MWEQMQSSPLAMGGQLIQEMVYPPEVARTQPLTAQQLERWEAPEPVQAWLDGLLATSPIEVVVVGDLPRERALELVARYLGSLPSRAAVEADSLADLRRLERPQGEGPRRLQKAIATETPQAFVFSGFYGADESNVDDMRALTVATMILTTRMIQEIREQEQLVYGIASGSRAATTYPGFGVVSASAPTDPAKVERLLNKIAAMYAALAEAGVTEEELAVAKRQVAVTLDQQLRDPDYWLSRLSKMVFLNRSLDDLAADPAAYQAMTAERLRETFARYYVPDSALEVVVTPADQEEAE